MANFVAHKDLEPPFVCLVASGGHSHIVSVEDYTHLEIMGRTRDDAAGEAFDKIARAWFWVIRAVRLLINLPKRVIRKRLISTRENG